MDELADHADDVVSITDYLRETIRDIDDTMAEWARRRAQLATRLAVLKAAADPDLQTAAADYEQRVAENRPYENSREADEVIEEAHRRFVG